MIEDGRASHWDEIYRTKLAAERSWSEPSASESFGLVRRCIESDASPIIDVGGGASPLAAQLCAAGCTDVTVVDISRTALSEAADAVDRTVHTVGIAPGITWVVADIRSWTPPRTFALWHDRAVFHFMVTDADRAGYLRALVAGTAAGSRVVLATFAPSGPTRCSGLEVRRWSGEELGAELGEWFDLVETHEYVHHTPWGAPQPFTWACLARR